jgi:3-hydroxyacyl-CoA dehydrogenase / enoyl-CoA hydratase / 3-hydroxybutyryl-CoA epimerase
MAPVFAKERPMTVTPPAFTMAVDPDGVAVITWDTPDKSMNVLSREAIVLLDGLVDAALADATVKGIVITSGKDTFAGGMDLNVLATISAEHPDDPAQALFDFTMAGHHMLRKIERAGMDPKTLKGGKPVAAALPGTALGIGLELPLACHRIFAADNPKAKIGLPEIMVGLFPGAGGTTRLVRKMGAMVASPFLLEGKLSSPIRPCVPGSSTKWCLLASWWTAPRPGSCPPRTPTS